VFGVLVNALGTVWYDDMEVSIESPDGAWAPLTIADPGFEDKDVLASWHVGVGRATAVPSAEGWSVAPDRERPASGGSALRVESKTRIVTEELFDASPAPGEVVDVELGSGLRARVPIALFSRDGHTIGDDPEFAKRWQASKRPAPTDRAMLSQVADVIVVWNVFEHFWPYWDLVSVDWSAALDAALGEAIHQRGIDDHRATLERLTAATPDAHVAVYCQDQRHDGYLPLALAVVEDQVVVITSQAEGVQRSDVLISIDGEPISRRLAAEQALISGSPQWRQVRSVDHLRRGKVGSSAVLKLQRSATTLEVRVARIDHTVPAESSHAAIERFEDGVYYIDLSRAEPAALQEIVQPLASAPGIVFDVRNRPNLDSSILYHLVTRLKEVRTWMPASLIIRPDTAPIAAQWEDGPSGTPVLLEARAPRFTGRVAFLTGPQAVSYPEGLLALVRHNHLGEIVGAPTAGTNGDVAVIGAPTGCRIRFTGRRTINPDGSRFHLLGVQPTLPATRTIAGIAAGRDEVLERALAYVRSGAK
jgi:hypothetical protein